MNDKIKELLENAEKTDSLAKLKWRIENREQLRKERKEKLKELMEKDKQQTAVEQFAIALYQKGLLIGNGDWMQDILDEFKEMEKEKHEKFNKFLNDEKQLGISDLKTIERIQWYYNTYFNETYGGGEQ